MHTSTFASVSRNNSVSVFSIICCLKGKNGSELQPKNTWGQEEHAAHFTCLPHRNPLRHGEQPPNQDLLHFPGTMSEQTGPASGGNFKLSHCKKSSCSLSSCWAHQKQAVPLEEQNRWKLECLPTKSLDKNQSLTGPTPASSKKLHEQRASLRRYLLWGKTGCYPSRTEVTECSQSCPTSPQDPAQQNTPWPKEAAEQLHDTESQHPPLQWFSWDGRLQSAAKVPGYHCPDTPGAAA